MLHSYLHTHYIFSHTYKEIIKLVQIHILLTMHPLFIVTISMVTVQNYSTYKPILQYSGSKLEHFQAAYLYTLGLATDLFNSQQCAYFNT